MASTALTILTIDAGAASAAPSLDSQMHQMNILQNGIPISQFLYDKQHRSDFGLTYFDWSTDECSAPLIGNGPYNFVDAYIRHDLGYRNLKRIESTSGKDVWWWRNKANVDTRSASDMNVRCREFNLLARQPCCSIAGVYENAVRAFGGGVPTQGAYYYSLDW